MEAGSQENAKIMEDLLQLLRDIVPRLESVRNSIQESTKRMPSASAQLTKVSKATETATVEILDLLETMTQRFVIAGRNLHDIRENVQQSRGTAYRTFQEIEAQYYVPLADKKIEEKMAGIRSYFMNSTIDKGFEDAEILLKTTMQDYTNIAMALQVQDITNQQIVGVSHIIESVQEQLAAALSRFEHNIPGEEIAASSGKKCEHAYDINGEYTKSPEKQFDADEIVRQWQNVHDSK
jgi:chemotaxis regulatin CheY-phosphate phosphatase CheZ